MLLQKSTVKSSHMSHNYCCCRSHNASFSPPSLGTKRTTTTSVSSFYSASLSGRTLTRITTPKIKTENSTMTHHALAKKKNQLYYYRCSHDGGRQQREQQQQQQQTKNGFDDGDECVVVFFCGENNQFTSG